MNIMEQMWEERSKKYGRKIEGVLPKLFPKAVNLYLDQWMFEQVSYAIEKDKKLKILDLGCGYGRLSKELLESYPNVETVGVDISENYVKLYNQDLKPRGHAIKADIRYLPFKKHVFDIVVVVTTLMYLTKKEDQRKCLKNLFQLLKQGGKFVVIERNPIGNNIVTFGGLVNKLRGQINKEITSVSFHPQYLSKLIKLSGGNISQREGLPVWTILLPELILSGFASEKICNFILKGVKLLDKLCARLIKPSLYVSYIGYV